MISKVFYVAFGLSVIVGLPTAMTTDQCRLHATANPLNPAVLVFSCPPTFCDDLSSCVMDTLDSTDSDSELGFIYYTCGCDGDVPYAPAIGCLGRGWVEYFEDGSEYDAECLFPEWCNPAQAGCVLNDPAATPGVPVLLCHC